MPQVLIIGFLAPNHGASSSPPSIAALARQRLRLRLERLATDQCQESV